MRQVMVRYKVKPDRVEENEQLVRAVYDELAAPAAGSATRRSGSTTASASSTSRRSRTSTTRWRRSRPSRASRPTSATVRRAAGRHGAARGRVLPPMRPSPLVHLELHTGDRERASALYAQLLGWRPRSVGSLPHARPRPRLRRRHRRMRDRAAGVDPLRRGRRRRRGHGAGGRARRVGPARAARRPGRPSQRRRGARGR